MANYGDYQRIAELVLGRLKRESVMTTHPDVDVSGMMIQEIHVDYTRNPDEIKVMQSAGADDRLGLIEPDKLAWEVARKVVCNKSVSDNKKYIDRTTHIIDVMCDEFNVRHPYDV
jgi:hypothetical protein